MVPRVEQLPHRLRWRRIRTRSKLKPNSRAHCSRAGASISAARCVSQRRRTCLTARTSLISPSRASNPLPSTLRRALRPLLPLKWICHRSLLAASSISSGGNGATGRARERASSRLRSIHVRCLSTNRSTVIADVREGTTTSTRPVWNTRTVKRRARLLSRTTHPWAAFLSDHNGNWDVTMPSTYRGRPDSISAPIGMLAKACV
jgi:hypothetical protein